MRAKISGNGLAQEAVSRPAEEDGDRISFVPARGEGSCAVLGHRPDVFRSYGSGRGVQTRVRVWMAIGRVSCRRTYGFNVFAVDDPLHADAGACGTRGVGRSPGTLEP